MMRYLFFLLAAAAMTVMVMYQHRADLIKAKNDIQAYQTRSLLPEDMP